MEYTEVQNLVESYKKYQENQKAVVSSALNTLSFSLDNSFDVEEYRLAGDLMAERLEKNYFLKQDAKGLQM